MGEKSTPRDRYDLEITLEDVADMQEGERQLAAEEAAQRDFRLRNGIPPNIEPRSIHSKVPDPQWKRKLRP